MTVQVNYDNIYHNEIIITGTNPLLSYVSNELFAAGIHGNNDNPVLEGYIGCLQDTRYNGQPLPTAGTNDIASIVYIGDTPMEGCNVGPCYPSNPCGSEGNCSEINNNDYECTCNNGDIIISSSCDRSRDKPSFDSVIAIAVSLVILIIILIIAMIIGVSIMYKRMNKWNKTELAAARLNNVPSAGNTSLDEFEIHENIYHYDNEDGEDDTSIGNIRQSRESLLQEEQQTDDNTPPLPRLPPLTGLPPPPVDHPIQRISPNTNRAGTPEIDAFIESRVNNANKLITDIDSLKSYNDEGMLSGANSLSTICSNTGYESYTVTQLRLAGPEFERIADLLEPVLVEDMESNESGYEGDDSHQFNIALVHNYK